MFRAAPLYDTPQNLLRTPLANAANRMLPLATITPEQCSEKVTPAFCLHLDTKSSVAGAMCTECGIVVASINSPVEQRGPVSMKPPKETSFLPSTTASSSNEADGSQARLEWEQHTKGVLEQPIEVMQHAWLIFQQVYSKQGSVSDSGFLFF